MKQTLLQSAFVALAKAVVIIFMFIPVCLICLVAAGASVFQFFRELVLAESGQDFRDRMDDL